MPFAEVREHQGAVLAGLAAQLSAMLDSRLDCFLPGFAKAQAVKAMMAECGLILEAQQCACVLRESYPVLADDMGDGVFFLAGDAFAAAEESLEDVKRASRLVTRLVDAILRRCAGDA
jgi:hypothetical protein